MPEPFAPTLHVVEEPAPIQGSMDRDFTRDLNEQVDDTLVRELVPVSGSLEVSDEAVGSVWHY